MQRKFVDPKNISDIKHELHSRSPLLTRLLVNRGIFTEEDAEKFLKPNYERDMNDPFLMNDMERAVVRIFEAIEAGEKIVIYSDYDCDGIPGAVILNDLFEKIGYKNFSVYIPDRHDEGYGLNKEAIAKFIQDEVSLLITIDLGTTDHEDIATAEAAGINVIVTDHHLPHETLPKAFAIVNPKLGEYPDPMLCGSGVVFKLVQAFLIKYREYFNREMKVAASLPAKGAQSSAAKTTTFISEKISPGWEKWLLDMAGLATLSDMVPLLGENRTIAYFGMQVLRKSPRPGLAQLLRILKIDQRNLLEDDITFMITPRINAASRMDSPMRAFELLSERSEAKAGALAMYLTKINDERKFLVAQIMKEVKHNLSEREIRDIIVIGNPKWRIGVLGIVAGKIMDEYDRPVFVWGREGATEEGEIVKVKGSCRSNGAVNVVKIMESMKETFLDFGGHELAGGFSVSQNEVHFLEDKLCAKYFELRSGSSEREIASAYLDEELSLKDVNEKTWDQVSLLAPFGLGNPKPVFIFKNVIIESMKQFGKEKNHLELSLIDDAGTEKTAIAFFADSDSFSKKFQTGERIDLIATLEKSYFLGRATLRLRIVDIT